MSHEGTKHYAPPHDPACMKCIRTKATKVKSYELSATLMQLWYNVSLTSIVAPLCIPIIWRARIVVVKFCEWRGESVCRPLFYGVCDKPGDVLKTHLHQTLLSWVHRIHHEEDTHGQSPTCNHTVDGAFELSIFFMHIGTIELYSRRHDDNSGHLRHECDFNFDFGTSFNFEISCLCMSGAFSGISTIRCRVNICLETESTTRPYNIYQPENNLSW